MYAKVYSLGVELFEKLAVPLRAGAEDLDEGAHQANTWAMFFMCIFGIASFQKAQDGNAILEFSVKLTFSDPFPKNVQIF